MEYFIAVVTWLLLIWTYHRYKYWRSNYGKFEYYLAGETNWFLREIILVFDILIFLAIIIGLLYLSGIFIKNIIGIYK